MPYHARHRPPARGDADARPPSPGAATRPRAGRGGPIRVNEERFASRSVSRVLYGEGEPSRDDHSSGTPVAGRLLRPTRVVMAGNAPPPLCGLAPGGVCRAGDVAASAVGSYPTVSPLPAGEPAGGLISVALSLGSPPPGVTRRRVSVEPGLSSPTAFRPCRSGRPTGWPGGYDPPAARTQCAAGDQSPPGNGKTERKKGSDQWPNPS